MKAHADRAKMVIVPETPAEHVKIGAIMEALEIPRDRLHRQDDGTEHLRLDSQDVLKVITRSGLRDRHARREGKQP